MLGAAAYAAVLVRAKARRARLIPPELWQQLWQAERLGDVLALLQHTAYAPLLTDKEPTPLLWARQADETRSLLRMLSGRARRLVAWYSRRFELDNLKTVLRALHYGLPQEARALLLPLPTPTLDWAALLAAGSVAALLARLRGTPYVQPLQLAFDRYQQEGLVFYLEMVLDLYYFTRLVRLIYQLSGEDRRQAERFLGRWIDVQNLSWAFRYRLYAGRKPEEIISYTLHQGVAVDLAAIRRVALGASVRAEAARLGLAVPAELSERAALAEFERLAAEALAAAARRTFRAAGFHLGVVLAYLALLEHELRELTRLLESKRSDAP